MTWPNRASAGRKSLRQRISKATPQQLEATLAFFDCDLLREFYTGMIRDLRRELDRRKAARPIVEHLMEALDARDDKPSLSPRPVGD